MKKLLGIIIGLLVVIIIIISVAFYTYVKNNENEILESNTINTNKQDLANTTKLENEISGNVSERIQSQVKFNDNECIAIGYVTDSNEARFADKYFPDGLYGQLAYYDFREPVNKVDNYGNKFVIVPINGDVIITVYECHIDEEGNILMDNPVIKSASEPFIMLDDYIEYIPKMCVKFEYNGYEDTFPLTFSGEDGSLDLSGHEMEVKDISLY